jgi:alkanesulfonate monooxygenase SsuD/methylene tetrahydromethanopterin reductase-like flavin-dependent oxidoreductase (luciferase family)
MPVKIGAFVVPDATHPERTLAQIIEADRAGLDIVGVQDHPYQRRFFDTWTLLAFAAARTDRIRLLPDVANLPLRPPAVLAKAAASLDLLSDGRVELGLGAGGFWDAIDAMGGPRRTPKESVDALEEAVQIIRAFLTADGPVKLDGKHYRLDGAKPGPAPAHPIGIWLGAYGPRMLRLTGRLADGWLPSLGGHYLSRDEALEKQTAVDHAAREAGRDPAQIERAVNLMALEGDPSDWAAQLASIATDLRFTTVLVGVPDEDPVGFVRRLAEIAPRVRQLVG